MRIAIRVDASQAIGTGHVRRMIALGQALRESGVEVRFVTRALGIDSAGMIARARFAGTVLLDPPGGAFTPDPAIPHSAWGEVDSGRDAAETIAALADFAPDWVVVDSYALDATWHAAVREGLGARIAVIDDLADRRLDADLVVDQNLPPDHRAKYRGLLGEGAVLLAGPGHAMLDPAYRDATRHVLSTRVRSVGVFMGGVDAGGFSVEALEALDLAGFTGPVEVVSTSANPALAALEAEIARRPGTRLAVDLPDLAGFFAVHDLQIGAGGGASWERCCIGPPTIGLIVAEHQRLSIPFLEAAGAVIGVDMLRDAATRRRDLVRAIERVLADADLRLRLHRAAMNLVDGRGAGRIAQALIECAAPDVIGERRTQLG